MFNDQTKTYISGLTDSELLEYVLTGRRMYEPEPLAFAREELDRRAISPAQLEVLRPPIVERLARYDAAQPAEENRGGIVCAKCGFEVPTKYAEYKQNIGAFILRFSKTFAGHFCRECNHRIFWKVTLINLFLGWWGIFSFLVTIGNLVGNFIMFLQSFAIPRRAPDAVQPFLDETICAKIESQITLISNRLDEGVDIADLAREVAPIAGVTPGQAYLFAQSLVRAKAESLKLVAAQGFPVIVNHLLS